MNVQQASSVSGRSGTTPSGIGKSLTLHDQISLTVIRPNNTKLEIMVHKKSAIMEVLSQIVPGKEETFVLEAYGVVFSRDETIADAIHKTRCGIFLLSEQSRPFPVYRDTVAAMEDSTIESRANIILKKHWEVFNHTTASLFGFATGALLQTKSSNMPSIPSNSIVSRPTSSYSEIAKMTSSHRPPSPLPSSTKYPSSSKTTSRPTIPNRKIPQTTSFASSNYASYGIAQSRLQIIQDNPNDHAQNLRLLTEFDVSEGDCSLSHLRMKRLLEADEITKKAKWQLVCAKDVHTFLCGVSITGAMFVLDVGTLKFCRRVNRVSTNVIMATYTYKEMKPAIVKVQLDNNKSTILYKPKRRDEFHEMHCATPEAVFCEVLAPLSMPKEHTLLIRKKFPTYEYVITLKYEARQIRIGRPDKLTNQEDPDITYTYGQAGFQDGLKRMFKILDQAEGRQAPARQALNLGDNAHAGNFRAWRLLVMSFLEDGVTATLPDTAVML